eukprot:6482932-Amphidinium_carterae.3
MSLTDSIILLQGSVLLLALFPRRRSCGVLLTLAHCIDPHLVSIRGEPGQKGHFASRICGSEDRAQNATCAVALEHLTSQILPETNTN